MKVIIEFDPNDPADRVLLERVLPQVAEAKPLTERGKAMPKAKKPAPSKRPPREKLSDALAKSQARASIPLKGQQDFSKATEQPLSDFPVVAGEIIAVPAAPLFPDGRDLLEGTFELPHDQPPTEPAAAEEEDHVRSIDDIAARYGGKP